jgi:hypothetical protein
MANYHNPKTGITVEANNIKSAKTKTKPRVARKAKIEEAKKKANKE